MFGKKKKTKTPDPIAATPEMATSTVDASEELIAIITAAIAAFEGSAATFTNGFVVRKINRISASGTIWSNAGINECIDSRRF